MPRGTNDGSIIRQKRDPVTGLMVDLPRIIVRRRYTDLKGRPREKKRYAQTPSKAAQLMRKLDKEIEAELSGIIQERQSRSFNELVTYCKERYLKPAEYAEETKISGLRSWATSLKYLLPPLESSFGPMALVAITFEDFEKYKLARLKGITKRGTKRTIATVNRELALARRMLTVALRKKWISEHPFNQGETPLVQMALESKRGRILSSDEEPKLFANCTGKRTRLPFAITMALETGLRKGEQFNLRREDVDLEKRLITTVSYKGKRVTRRFVPIVEQLYHQLAAHMASHDKPTVFTIRDPRKAFEGACEDAGIKDFTWHDLRHTAITRMVHVYKIPPLDVMKISGHTVWKTFFETYVNIDEEIARSIGAQIDAARADLERLVTFPVKVEEEVSDLVN